MLVDISPVRSKDTSTTIMNFQAESSPCTRGDRLLEDEQFNFDISASPPFDVNADDTFRRLSALSPFEVAELCEQANTVAIQFRKAADELRSCDQCSASVPHVKNAAGTSNDTQCPVSAQIDAVETLPGSRSTDAVLTSKANKTSVVKPFQSQTKGKDVPPARKSVSSALKENKAPAAAVLPSAGRKALPGVPKVNRFMVTKPPIGVPSKAKSSLANTSVSSCDSVSSTSSVASAAARLTTSRPAATSTPAADRGSVKLAHTKSLNLATKPAPITRRARPSIGAAAAAQLLKSDSEVKPATKPLSQATMKRRLSVYVSSKSASGEKMPPPSSSAVAACKPPPSSSAMAACKPPPGQSRKVPKGAAAAADNKHTWKK